MKKVVVVGSLNYDFFLLLAGTPKVGETVHANESGRGAGGKGADQAVQIAKQIVGNNSICTVGGILIIDYG